MKTAAIYSRVSTSDQDTNKQIKMCREYCERMGYKIYKVYKDEISGTTTSRPAFNEMLESMRLWKFNTLVVTKLDRIGRSLKHLLSLFEEFNKKGIHFVSITQNIDTSTSAGKLQMHILSAFAEFERNIISERTKESLVGNPNVGKRGKDRKPRQKRGVSRKPSLYE